MSATGTFQRALGSPAPPARLVDLAPGLSPAQARHRSERENFPVALSLLPSALREDLFALYGFARYVDDLGDEAHGDRPALLDMLDEELSLMETGCATHPVIVRLGGMARRRNVPIGPFRRLVEANRMDQSVSRYGTFEDLLAYCDLSANPVGEVVLHIFGAASPERIKWSDSVCSALQVIEHLQDIGEDFSRGRVYLPRADMDRFGVPESSLAQPEGTRELRRLLAWESRRSAEMLDDGRKLVASLGGWGRMAVAGFVGGGRSALEAIADSGYDTLANSALPSKSLTGWRAIQALLLPRRHWGPL